MSERAGADMDTAGEQGRHEALRTIGQFVEWSSLCWCGNSEKFLAFLAAALERTQAPDQEQFDPANPLHVVGAYLLDLWDLSDHGTSIYGSWLTEDGERLRDALRQVDLDTVMDDLRSWRQRERQLYPRGRVGGDDTSPYGRWPERPPAVEAVPAEAKHPANEVPDHIVTQLLGIMRPHRSPAPVGSVDYVRGARAEAREFARRWWAEAFAAGTQYGLMLGAAPRMVALPAPDSGASVWVAPLGTRPGSAGRVDMCTDPVGDLRGTPTPVGVPLEVRSRLVEISPAHRRYVMSQQPPEGVCWTQQQAESLIGCTAVFGVSTDESGEPVSAGGGVVTAARVVDDGAAMMIDVDTLVAEVRARRAAQLFDPDSANPDEPVGVPVRPMEVVTLPDADVDGRGAEGDERRGGG